MIQTIDYGKYSITELKIDPPIQIMHDTNLFGVDPGTVHLGLAFIWRSSCHIFEAKINRSSDPVERICITQEIMRKCFTLYEYTSLMVIEGSAFSSGYRQVELAEVRAAAVLWAIEHNIKPTIVTPTHIRKVVFGSAKLRAEVEWNLRDHPNAASALACAYYSIKK